MIYIAFITKKRKKKSVAVLYKDIYIYIVNIGIWNKKLHVLLIVVWFTERKSHRREPSLQPKISLNILC